VTVAGLLRELVEIESPSHSTGVRAVAEVMQRELTALGAEVTLLEGNHLRAELRGEGTPLLLLGHTDTVWPLGTLAEMPYRVDGDRAHGPGAYDMKAGLVVLLEALRDRGRRALRVFLTADEEIGSRTGAPLLEQAGDGVAAALVLEPPTPEGHLKTARKGLGRFRFTIAGRPAHAGTDHAAGASAIDELARLILKLHALNGGGVTVNVGVVSGGTAENVVPETAEAQVDVRVPTWAERERMERELAALGPELEGTSIELAGGWTRPPLEPTTASRALFERARAQAHELGLDLRQASSGGGSDGNLVAALGVPVLDGLGAEGGGAHARDEHVLLPSIPTRARLLSRLLRDPSL
jgi:glutamate carboxypeptidase